VLAAVLALAAASPYVAEVEQWRVKREERLKADGGWLTVSGLYWLKDGPNTLGSARGNDVVLPGSAPVRVGVIDFSGGKATLRVEPGVRVLSADKPVTAPMDLRADTASDGPDVLVLGPLSLQVIERGGRYGLRLKDNESATRREFKGLQWYPVSEAHRVTARFVPHATPKTIAIANVLGQEDQLPSPGYAVFTIGGQEVRLEPILEAPDARSSSSSSRIRRRGATPTPPVVTCTRSCRRTAR
jgi:hypothetical protein